jgi:arabinogalactan oligomer/maltooligosaccharide transport system permease protein
VVGEPDDTYGEPLNEAGSPTTAAPRRGAPAPRRGGLGPISVPMVAKYVVLIVLNGIVLSGITAMIEQKAWGLMAGVIIAIVALDVVYFSPRRFIPGKYLVPGTIFLVFFAVFPVIYTLYISFTNYGTGNILSKPTAITTIELSSLEPPTATSKTYVLQVMAKGDVTGPIAFFLTDPATSVDQLGLLDG